jgi:hypothetical protein
MDRHSLRGLRAQPGYLKFLSAATLARVSDEMFSVGVVLLVLERTDSAGLAGAAVAAITLPSLISGPLRVGDPARGAAGGRHLPTLVRRLHEHDPRARAG